MLSLLRKIPDSNLHVSSYKWDYTKFLGRQVKDLRIGIVGYGRLGKMMDKFCRAFDAKTFLYDPYVDVEQTSLEDMVKICDVISLHVHVTPETVNLINKRILDLSQKDLYIINTSRGDIVNEVDIVNALYGGSLTGYATDVIKHEFGSLSKSPIIRAMNKGMNIIATPHTGGMTLEGQLKAYKWSINKL
jgi:D-3-phosphoglycerate dehydrogenase / 2-oxoglutarate reductase